jgi:lysine-specific demethylase 8
MKVVERIPAPTRSEFEQRWLKRKSPVVMTGALEDWPARRLWSAEYFREKFGDRLLPVAHTDEQRLRHDPASGIPYRPMKLGEYLDRPDGYSIFIIEDALPELLRDLPRPAWCPERGWSMRKLWLSPGGTGSPLHQDLTENLYAQVVGRKQITLFPPGDGRYLYRYPLLSKLPNFSRVDVEAPDHARFPRFRRAQPLTLVLEPGELLYLPRLWWHQMRSLDFSVSTSYWWATGAVQVAVKAAILYKKLRALRY